MTVHGRIVKTVITGSREPIEGAGKLFFHHMKAIPKNMKDLQFKFCIFYLRLPNHAVDLYQN